MPRKRKSALSRNSTPVRKAKVTRNKECEVQAELRRQQQADRQRVLRAAETSHQARVRSKRQAKQQEARRATETQEQLQARRIHDAEVRTTRRRNFITKNWNIYKIYSLYGSISTIMISVIYLMDSMRAKPRVKASILYKYIGTLHEY